MSNPTNQPSDSNKDDTTKQIAKQTANQQPDTQKTDKADLAEDNLYAPPTTVQQPKFSFGKLVYLPRSRRLKLLPATVLSALMVFIFCYAIAHGYERLLSGQFLLGVPFFLGAWVSYFVSYQNPVSSGQIFKAICWLMLAIIIISMPILREGVICIVMASPAIFVLLLLGAFSMRWFCQKIWKSHVLHSVVLLPLLVLFMPWAEQSHTYQHQQSLVIQATPEQIWQAINHVENIEPQQFYQHSKLLPLLGVPTPKSAQTVWENGQAVRKCEWHKGIYFDEPIISQIPNQQLRWQFKFYPDSVPSGALDDHVTINGEHFKLLLGQYDITAIDPHTSKLTFTVNYRITTNINAYAGFWGKWVMKDFTTDVLDFYKRQVEALPNT
ncbi:hypothetical protein [Psychrobacter sp. I-STPA6b]|uniref:hypothetical protein n=1 Tax=Psychrobacter sp. I-STPA6b TaxID=2585718 RepID=UPI001D0C48AF|nr:hypothetical protein [Psychrobacter sp. I-STPA6b]